MFRYLALASLLSIFAVISLTLMSDGMLTSPIYDPDSLMRMARLRDSLESGTWLHVIPGGDSGAGLSIHWSHLLDFALAPFVLLLEPSLGINDAITWVAYFTGPVGMGLLSAACCWAIAPLAPPRATWVQIPILLTLSPIYMSYGEWGTADHHVVQAMLVVLTFGFAARTCHTGSLVQGGWTGLCMGFCLWVSPEGLLYGVMASGLIWMAWLTGSDRIQRARLGASLAAWSIAFLLLTYLAVLIDPPAVTHAAELDRISPFYLHAALVAGLMTACTVQFAAGKLGLRLAAFIVCALLGAVILYSLETEALLSLYMAPNVSARTFDWSAVSELQSVRSVPELIGWAGLPLATTCISVWLLRGRTSLPVLAFGAFSALAAILLMCQFVRFATYTAALSACASAIILYQLQGRPGLIGSKGFRDISLVLAINIPLISLSMIGGVPSAGGYGSEAPGRCHVEQVSAALREHPGKLVWSDPGLAPQIAWLAPQSPFFAAYYHRDEMSLADNMDIMASPASGTAALMRGHGIELVILCPGSADPSQEVPGEMFRDMLDSGRFPEWLLPVTQVKGNGEAVLFSLRP